MLKGSRPPAVPAALLGSLPPAPVVDVLKRLQRAGHQAFLVGGCVRDPLRGVAAKDYDVATSAKPNQVKELFHRVVPTGEAHGTMTVLTRGGPPVEVTTFRGEGAYLDGRHPSEVRFLEDVREDLARRDFTINAMAFDPVAPSFVDPFGGIADLARRRVRCVGDPAERFAEDGLRPMRAVRFASVLGFSVDAKTRAAIPASLATFRRVAVERVREEFSRIMTGPLPSRGLKLLAATGLFAEFLPEVPALRGGRDPAFAHVLATVDRAPPRIEVRLAALLHAVGRAVCHGGGGEGAAAATQAVLTRLRCARKTLDVAELLVRELPFAEDVADDDRALRRLVARVGARHVEALCALARAHAAAKGRGGRAAVERAARISGRLDAIVASKPAVTVSSLALRGNEVMAILGEKAGPRVGEALRFLLDQVLDDPELNTREDIERLVREWAGRGTGSCTCPSGG